MTTQISSPATAARHRPAAILPQHAGYDAARQAWNLAADQRPAAVVVARTAQDVADAMTLAREHDLRIAPQGTGHLAGALPDLDDTILLRTAIAGGVEVDAVARRARVPAGTVWREVVEAVEPHGLAALSGSSHDVGVLGYALGGGMSWLARRHGLTTNHVHAIELVTAAGEQLRVDHEHEPDLFWALRGGGANFGIVTHVEIGLFPVTELYAGMTVWPAERAREVLTAWIEWTRTAPDAVTTSARLLRMPPLPGVPEPLSDTPVVVIDGAVLPGEADAAEVLRPLRDLAGATMDTWMAMPPSGLLEIHMDPPEPVPAAGHHALLEDIGERGLDALLAAVDPQTISPLLFAELRQLGGALGRAPQDGGARSALEGAFGLFGVGMVTSPDQADELERGLDALVGAMAPWATGTVYANFAERGGSAASAFAPADYERLVALREAWDPQGLLVASHRIG